MDKALWQDLCLSRKIGGVLVAKSVKEIVDALNRAFPDGPPDESLIRSQGFDFLTHHWVDRWPAGLMLPKLLQGIGRKRLTRADVFSRARDVVSDDSLVELYVAVCAWGTGTKAQRVARCVKPLYEKGAIASLSRSFEALQAQHPVEVYRRLNSWDGDRVKHFGPAFFTKWMYFSAYDRMDKLEGPAPLILDKRVALAMGWSPSGWRSADYARYLDLVAELRETWCPFQSAHVIEYSLFSLGGDLS
jgi:hypothetical protein